tara:strand:- start:294 stop:623 length:330 start_codon:yes stop_codon:yes gene_type:complete
LILAFIGNFLVINYTPSLDYALSLLEDMGRREVYSCLAGDADGSVQLVVQPHGHDLIMRQDGLGGALPILAVVVKDEVGLGNPLQLRDPCKIKLGFRIDRGTFRIQDER